MYPSIYLSIYLSIHISTHISFHVSSLFSAQAFLLQHQSELRLQSYWGEALAYKQPLWNIEFVQLADGVWSRAEQDPLFHAAVSHLGPAHRDVLMIYAVKHFINSSHSSKDRTEEYARNLHSLSLIYPNDIDISAFHALALMAQAAISPAKQRQPLLDTAESILTPLLQLPPPPPPPLYHLPKDSSSSIIITNHHTRTGRHVGILHYYVHLKDELDPHIARQGLKVGHWLADAAPHSSHALHMVSHLYLTCGEWAQVAKFNSLSVAADDDGICRAYTGDNVDDCDADNKVTMQNYNRTDSKRLKKQLLFILSFIRLNGTTILFYKWEMSMLQKSHWIV